MINKKSITVALACAGALLTTPTFAEDLIFFEENGGPNGPRGLYNLDSDTGNITLRTTVPGSERIFSMTIDPVSGDVYGYDPLAVKLYTVDVDNGSLTLIGNISGFDSTVADITFKADGTLWALDRNPPQTLYQIDLNSLTATPIGSTNVVRTGLTWLGNTLYGFSLDGALYEIDPNTGIDTFIGGGGVVNLIEDATAGADGMLYFSGWTGELYQVDPANGNATFINNTGNDGGCLGIIGEPTTGPSECVTLANNGLVAGQTTTWRITGATPGQKVVVVYGTAPGQTIVNGAAGYCATFGIKGVNASKLIGNPKSADANGTAIWKRPIPGNLKGVRVLTQGAGAGSCPDDCQSNLLDQVIG